MKNATYGRESVSIPGPSIMPDAVLAAMARPMPDIYDGEIVTVSDEVYANLSTLAGSTAQPYVTTSNGHGAWEMAMTNTLSPGDKVLALNCGRFGVMWARAAADLGLDVTVLESPLGMPDNPEQLAAALANDPERNIAAVIMVHTETATGVRNDIPAFRKVLDDADHPALLMVDCIASMGCERFEMDAWGVDLALTASQKGLMTPPGLGVVWAGARARAASATSTLRSAYWDWAGRNPNDPPYLRYCGTPPVSHLFAIQVALRMILDEGLEARWARHARLAGAVRAAVDAWSTPGGIGFHAAATEQKSDAVTSILTGTVDADALCALTQSQLGVTLGMGMAPAPGSSFRIGHMGYLNEQMILGTLGAVEVGLHAIGAPLGGSGVAAATALLGASCVDAKVNGVPCRDGVCCG